MKTQSPMAPFIDLNDPRFREVGRDMLYQRMMELAHNAPANAAVFTLFDVAAKSQQPLTVEDVLQILDDEEEPLYSAIMQIFIDANRDEFERRAEQALVYINQVTTMVATAFASMLNASVAATEKKNLTPDISRESKLKKHFTNNGNA